MTDLTDLTKHLTNEHLLPWLALMTWRADLKRNPVTHIDADLAVIIMKG